MTRFFAIVGATLWAVVLVAADELPKAQGTVPDGYVSIGSAVGGQYVVSQPLKNKYDQLRSRARVLKDQIANREIGEEEARGQLQQLQRELADTLKEIEDTKQVVTAAKIHTKKETTRFKPGPERCLLIRADKVRIVGWKEAEVECVLDKVVLSVGGEGVDEDLQGIKVAHRHGIASDDVGQTEQQRVQSLKKEPSELTHLQRELIRDNVAYYAPLAALQGKEIDVLEIEGLTHDQGNRQISIELQGKEGASYSSQWRRHATLTVYVPACNWVGIRGGRKGIDIKSLQGSVAILGENDIDYDAQSRIIDVTGAVLAHNAFVHVVANIGGDVSVQQTAFEENTGTAHQGSGRTTYAGSPRPCTYQNIAGNLRLAFCRAELHLEKIAGLMDVQNEFGDTTLVADQPLTPGAHRLVSESGSIDIKIQQKVARDLPLIALTECGVVKCVNAKDDLLASKNITATTQPDRATRNWKGFVSSQIQFLALTERINTALTGQERTAGLDLISRAGMIRLELTQ